MKTNILCLVSLFFFSLVFSQKQVFETNKAFQKPKNNSNTSYALSNSQTDEVLLIAEGSELIRAILLDKDYQIKNQSIAKPLQSGFSDFIGYKITKDLYTIFFTNTKQNKFGVLEFDMSNKMYATKKLDFKLKKEKFVESVFYNNEMYLFTISKQSSNINMYVFDDDYNTSKHSFSFKEAEFPNPNSPSFILDVYDQLVAGSDTFSPVILNLAKIADENPNVIETTSKEIKLYLKGKHVIFTFDKNHVKTDVFTINLETKDLEHKAFDKVSKERNEYKKHNSFLYDDILFQIASENDKMNFRAIEISSGAIINEYLTAKEDTIFYKNSPIIQEKSTSDFLGKPVENNRNLEKTKQFLRKISSADLGISVYENNDIYNIVLGGTKAIAGTGGVAAMAFGVAGGMAGAALAGGIANMNYSFNPVFYGYSSYQNTKSTYINCLFDKNLNHVEGKIPYNTYDDINDFESGLEKPKAINVFMHKDKLHYNYLDRETGIFRLYIFEN